MTEKQKKGFAIHPENINKAGRPKGSLSAMGRIKKMLEDDPDRFDRILEAYLKDAEKESIDRRDLIDRIDGKPIQKIVGDDEHPPFQLVIKRK